MIEGVAQIHHGLNRDGVIDNNRPLLDQPRPKDATLRVANKEP